LGGKFELCGRRWKKKRAVGHEIFGSETHVVVSKFWR
jgi:hypothetical protein